MEMKKKRFGSFLCFSPPVDDDDDEKSNKSKKSNRKIVTKIVRTMSLKSSSSKRGRKSEKDRGISRSQTGTDSFRENLTYPSIRSSSPQSISSDNIVADNNLSSQRLRNEKKKTPSMTCRKYRSFVAICLMMLSLSVMIFFGRLFAVLLTTVWMCFVPRRRLKGELSNIADVGGMRKLQEE